MQETLIRFWERQSDAILKSALQVALIIVLVIVARWLGGRVILFITRALTSKIEISERRQAQIKTIGALLNSILGYALLFVGLLSILGALGVNLGPVLATVGVTGLAVSFGAQQLVRDVINGFFILVEDQFTVGEEVTIDGVHGTVETMGMRITRIRDDQGRLVTFANSSINRVINHSRGKAAISVEVGVAAEYGLTAAREWLKETVCVFRHPALQGELEVVGPRTLDTTRYTFQIRGHAFPSQADTVADALREHLLLQAKADGTPLS